MEIIALKVQVDKSALDSLKQDVSNIQNTKLDLKISGASDARKQVQETTKSVQDLYQNLGTMAARRVGTKAVQAFTQALREAVQTLKDVDSELVTVRKVTDFGADKMKAIEEQAYKTAAALGMEADAYLESVSAFARAGYKDRAADLAELSTKTQLVGDVTAETANQFLLAVDKAYQFEGSVEKLGRVLDGTNEIDNNFATSIEKIAEGLGKIAPLASQTHVGVDELSAALLEKYTALGNAIEVDGEKLTGLAAAQARLESWGLSVTEKTVKRMLYRTLKRMIERGQTAGMAAKLDIFFAADKITEAEYSELTAMLEAAE